MKLEERIPLKEQDNNYIRLFVRNYASKSRVKKKYLEKNTLKKTTEKPTNLDFYIQ